MKRNLFAGRRRSGGLRLDVFTEAELNDIHLDARGARADRHVGGGRRCARHLQRRRLRRRPRDAHGAHPAAPRRGRDPLARRPRASSAAATRSRTSSSRPAASASPTSTRASWSSTRAPASCATRCCRTCTRPHAWSTRSATSTPTSAVVHPATCRRRRRPPQVGGGDPQHEQAGRHRGHQRRLRLPQARSRWPRWSRAARTSSARRPLIGFGVCPVSPLKLPRDAAEVIIESARAGARTRPQHGDVRRLVTGDARRHARHCTTPRCSPASCSRSSSSAAARSAYGSSTTAMDLQAGGGLAWARRSSRCFSAACAQIARQLPAAELRGRVVGGLQAR